MYGCLTPNLEKMDLAGGLDVGPLIAGPAEGGLIGFGGDAPSVGLDEVMTRL